MLWNWKVNVILGGMAFLLTYVCSFTNNTWQTSLFRSGIGFLLFFIFGYVFRSVLYQITAIKSPNQMMDSKNTEQDGRVEEFNRMEEQQAEEPSFQEIPLTSLHKGMETKDTEKIARTIQSWTANDKEG
ncbi:hypothetical protein [Bacillus xiapuensis]|uniref:Uncharacterized protein n=1 Tax=Bacillus xiapuensis TaxID=2014075 RepID=A0ABU6NBT1_9BACI|nr:hypothetical protein [Bacillus xiapuensis]